MVSPPSAGKPVILFCLVGASQSKSLFAVLWRRQFGDLARVCGRSGQRPSEYAVGRGLLIDSG